MADDARPTKKRKTADKANKLGDDAALPSVGTISEDTAKVKKGPDARRSLFVRSLPVDITSDALAAHFSESFPVKHAVAVTDKETKKGKGYGFVTLTDAEDAQRACEELDGSSLSGKKIRVEIAESRQREDGEGQPKTTPARAKKVDEARQPPKLIVRNLPWSISNPDELSKLFRSYGKVKLAVLPKKGSKLSGFGIVVIRGRQNAEKALAGVNGKEIDGRTLAVDWAVDKETWEKTKEEPESVALDTEKDTDAKAELEEDLDEASEADSFNGVDLDIQAEDEEDEEDEDLSEEDVNGDLQDEEDDEEEEEEELEDRNRSTTIFIRNLPFTTEDEDLYNHFRQFGSLRYARVVLDPNTERSRGTGFVCFVEADECLSCLKGSPKVSKSLPGKGVKDASAIGPSVLQDEAVDESGKYTLEGRVLSISQAVSRSDASRLTVEGEKIRNARDNDKRRLYLLSEGTIPSNSALYTSLSPSEIAMREASAKQRKMLIQSNPSLHISLTRLSIRNIPRSIDSKALKALARYAVVGFATDVKEGKRQALSKEELARGQEEMRKAEAERKAKGKGVVRQAKVVFESHEGNKVKEADGGRSRGYGFIEYYTHRSALMGLRWLNGHAVGKAQKQKKSASDGADDLQDRKKRLIVEFAIENAQVVHRRQERETKSRSTEKGQSSRPPRYTAQRPAGTEKKTLGKRKRTAEDKAVTKPQADLPEVEEPSKDNKLAKRNRIIAKKRAMRRTRKGAA